MFCLCILEQCRKVITLAGGYVVPVEQAVMEEEVYNIFEGKLQLKCRVKKLLVQYL